MVWAMQAPFAKWKPTLHATQSSAACVVQRAPVAMPPLAQLHVFASQRSKSYERWNAPLHDVHIRPPWFGHPLPEAAEPWLQLQCLVAQTRSSVSDGAYVSY
jgi:hypothetical protein